MWGRPSGRGDSFPPIFPPMIISRKTDQHTGGFNRLIWYYFFEIRSSSLVTFFHGYDLGGQLLGDPLGADSGMLRRVWEEEVGGGYMFCFSVSLSKRKWEVHLGVSFL